MSIIKSKDGCPECGGTSWCPMYLNDNNDLIPCGSGISGKDLVVEGYDERPPAGSSRCWVGHRDECVGCGLVLCV